MISPHEVLAELIELRDGIDAGRYARDEKTTIKCKKLGNLVTILELAKEHQQLAGQLEAQPPLDRLIKEARRVLTEILERLAQPMH